MSNLTSVEIKNLSFAYPHKHNKPIIKNVNWNIATGEHIYLFGPSGSGKSTLLNLICGILTPNDGSIQILGKDFNHLSMRQRDNFRAKHIGVVFQQFNLIPYLNTLDNIKLAANFGHQTYHHLQADIIDLLEQLKLPKSLLQHRADQLSIGQQQRVAIVRALINNPEIIIADEPTSALDTDTKDEFMQLLLDCVKKNNSTLIFVSHDRSLQNFFSQSIDISQLNPI